MRRRKHKLLLRWCFYCGAQLTRNNFTRDHLLPKSRGGKAKVDSCNVCNERKGSKTLLEFRVDFLGSETAKFPGEAKRELEYAQ